VTGSSSARTATKTTIVTEFDSISAEWDALVPLTHRGGVFLESDWMRSAWAWRALSARLHVVRVARGSEVIGFVPLVETAASRVGRSVRQLEFLEIPDTQFCDVICQISELDTVCVALAKHLSSTHTAWDEVSLAKLDAASATAPALARAFTAEGLAAYIGELDVVPGVRLTNSWDAYYATRTRRLKKANNHLANRLKRAASSIEIERVTGAQLRAEDLQTAYDAVASVSSRSWKSSTGLTFEHSGPQRFLRELIQRASDRGWLSLWFLRLDGTVVATELQLVYDGTVSALRSDYDPAYAELSAGSYLNWQLLKQLFDGANSYYCMGPGTNEYKLRWADERPEHCTLRGYNRTARGLLGRIEDRAARPVLRRVFRRNAQPAVVSTSEDS
jgi:hypothetical protein